LLPQLLFEQLALGDVEREADIFVGAGEYARIATTTETRSPLRRMNSFSYGAQTAGRRTWANARASIWRYSAGVWATRLILPSPGLPR
jgi:hypothetical protein